MDLASLLFLAIVQGVTEWLPVSSSGHLVLAQTLLGLENPIIIDTALHLATLIAAFIVFWTDIKGMIRALATWKTTTKEFRLAWYVIIGTIPIVIIGLLFQDLIEAAFTSLLVVGIGLLVTGTILHFTRYANERGPLTPKRAIIIGTAQVIALLPGISRSGTTISAGLFTGLTSEDAARFSFLLFLPAVGGAALLQAVTADLSNIPWGSLIAAMVLCVAVSVFALEWLLKIIRKGALHRFSWYCWAIGLVAIILWFFPL